MKELCTVYSKSFDIKECSISNFLRESVKFKLNLLKERTHVDQKKLEERIKELQLLLEQDKQVKEFIEFKGKDRSALR